MRVIASDGSMLGIMPAAQAQRLAYDQELDLVKISPTANPPVCKIMDYSKFKYEQAKRIRKTERTRPL